MTTYFICGANRGIGFNIVKKLLQTPEDIVIATVRDKTKTNLSSIETKKLFLVEADFSDDFEKIKKSFDPIESQFPKGVDVVVYNAGILPDEPQVDIEIEAVAKCMEVNFLGAAKAYNAIKPHWIKHDNGVQKKFYFISSTVGLTTFEYPMRPVGYGSSKAALIYLANALALQATQSSDKLFHESLIAAISPGLVATDMVIGKLPEERMQYALSPEKSAECIEGIILNPKPEQHGALIDYNGELR